MTEIPVAGSPYRFYPLTPERWADFEKLFGPRGACAGCWCMFWRLAMKEYRQGQGEPNKRAMKTLVESGKRPGILAYDRERAVGWCSLAPRTEFPRFETTRTLKPVDDRPVWSIVCLFVAKEYRRHGLSGELLKAAVSFAAGEGAEIVEGYPRTKPEGVNLFDLFIYTGIFSAFERAGFSEVQRPTPIRVIARFYIER
ncbi:MAG: GNAT family N-acetyltransferase [Candidatus Glassbacteria bacterium RIFCSPLOWO2_12_FULL_58_11]|uniref:GNAT family N-acetyltransferase n=1 Tax=Candidatus Glassbacteria bacterium RIFCSPLOWO2_12_FULL_58_11 TaxID=1817867 RepID=A0A1F5YLS4_9BACT|nr:MAG: GNAT family N-acetyltransferase [Candidatus Glassbacteria bacterium RIFCSPLOWO2_12_FULL_58_11]